MICHEAVGLLVSNCGVISFLFLEIKMFTFLFVCSLSTVFDQYNASS